MVMFISHTLIPRAVGGPYYTQTYVRTICPAEGPLVLNPVKPHYYHQADICTRSNCWGFSYIY